MKNCTPHDITVGEVTIPRSGIVARVEVSYGLSIERVFGVDVVRRATGNITGLPRDEQGHIEPCIVSAMVLAALPAGTRNVYAPDTGDTAIRNEAGHIISVTRLIAA